MQLIELATSLNKYRSLTEREAGWLYGAIRREKRRGGENLKQRWLAKDDIALKRLLRHGKRPRDIARAIGRTEDAVWSRMKALRKAGKLSCSQSPVAQMAAGEG